MLRSAITAHRKESKHVAQRGTEVPKGTPVGS